MGDIVVLKGSTLHWVRSLGFSTHWNTFPIEYEQIHQTLLRVKDNNYYLNNYNIHPNKIPIKKLLYELIRRTMAVSNDNNSINDNNSNHLINYSTNHHHHLKECNNNNLDDYCRQKLWYINDTKTIYNYDVIKLLIRHTYKSISDENAWMAEVQHITKLAPTPEPINCSRIFCSRSFCQSELFGSYVYCRACGIICLQCACTFCDGKKVQIVRDPVVNLHSLDNKVENNSLSAFVHHDTTSYFYIKPIWYQTELVFQKFLEKSIEILPEKDVSILNSLIKNLSNSIPISLHNLREARKGRLMLSEYPPEVKYNTGFIPESLSMTLGCRGPLKSSKGIKYNTTNRDVNSNNKISMVSKRKNVTNSKNDDVILDNNNDDDDNNNNNNNTKVKKKRGRKKKIIITENHIDHSNSIPSNIDGKDTDNHNNNGNDVNNNTKHKDDTEKIIRKKRKYQFHEKDDYQASQDKTLVINTEGIIDKQYKRKRTQLTSAKKVVEDSGDLQLQEGQNGWTAKRKMKRAYNKSNRFVNYNKSKKLKKNMVKLNENNIDDNINVNTPFEKQPKKKGRKKKSELLLLNQEGLINIDQTKKELKKKSKLITNISSHRVLRNRNHDILQNSMDENTEKIIFDEEIDEDQMLETNSRVTLLGTDDVIVMDDSMQVSGEAVEAHHDVEVEFEDDCVQENEVDFAYESRRYG